MFAQPGADVVPPRPPSPTLGCARAGGTPIALGVPPRPPRHWGEARMPAGGGRGRRRAHHCCYGTPHALKALGGESPAGAGMGAPGHVAAGAWPDRVRLRLRRVSAGAEWVPPSHVAAGAWPDRGPLRLRRLPARGGQGAAASLRLPAGGVQGAVSSGRLPAGGGQNAAASLGVPAGGGQGAFLAVLLAAVGGIAPRPGRSGRPGLGGAGPLGGPRDEAHFVRGFRMYGARQGRRTRSRG